MEVSDQHDAGKIPLYPLDIRLGIIETDLREIEREDVDEIKLVQIWR
jgi:hypothetical protein